MKTSRIIFITFFSIIGLFLFSLMIMGFMFKNKEYNNFRPENLISESIPLEGFSHIVSEPNCRIELKSGDANQLNYASLADKEIVKPIFNLKDDTLFITTTRTNMNNDVQITVQQIKTITGCNNNLTLRDFSQDSIKVILNGTEISLQQNTSIGKLELSLKSQSRCNGWNCQITNLNLTSDNSKFEASIQNRLESVKVDIANHSEVRLPKSLNYNLNLDKTSKVKVY